MVLGARREKIPGYAPGLDYLCLKKIAQLAFEPWPQFEVGEWLTLFFAQFKTKQNFQSSSYFENVAVVVAAVNVAVVVNVANVANVANDHESCFSK